MARLTLVGALGLAGSSCSGPDDEIVIELGMDGWTASGDLVDDGSMCFGGLLHSTGYENLDGSPLTPAAGFELKVEAIFAEEAAPTHRELLQHLCADGSGWFTVAYASGVGGEWEVTDGAGVYRGMRGSGPLVIECDVPSTDPELPPCLSPRTVATGSVELPAGD